MARLGVHGALRWLPCSAAAVAAVAAGSSAAGGERGGVKAVRRVLHFC